jgi:hypothetical protein
MIGKAGQVSRLSLKEVSIIGGSGAASSCVGAMAGYSGGTLTDCLASGTVSAGCNFVNALVGDNDGSMVDCTSDVSVIRAGCSRR